VSATGVAVAADPDRDRVLIVDAGGTRAVSVIELGAGDEPARVALGSVPSDSSVPVEAEERAFVALRGGGAVVTLDLATASLVERREVCDAPRGLAVDVAREALYVACAGGALVTLPLAGGGVTRTVDLGPDLRDVVVLSDRLMVSRFRSAELLEVDANGNVVSATTPTPVTTQGSGATVDSRGNGVLRPITRHQTPSVAWRMISDGQGGVAMLHQRGTSDVLELLGGAPVYYEGTSSTGASCAAVVQPAVTVVGAGGSEFASAPLAGVALAVDAAVSPDASQIAIVNAGPRDRKAPIQETLRGNADPTPIPESPDPPVIARVMNLSGLHSVQEDTPPDFESACASAQTVSGPSPAIAVAWGPNHELFVQTREPSRLLVYRSRLSDPDVIELGGASVLDTGHELFHRDAGLGVACASCHPEGREDGRVWNFGDVGKRRTQPLDTGLEGTEPFHWNGGLPALSHLMLDVFVTRMGGVVQSPERIAALERWLYARKPLPPLLSGDDPSVARGRNLFASPEVGCVECHAGDKFTLQESVVVRPGDEPLQVPNLVGVGYRAPFMHDGCAATLEQRFDPTCGGGEAHGNTEQLSPEELLDLVSYLRSL